MSRAYRIRVSQSGRRIVRSGDSAKSCLELLPILAPERMAEIVAAELARRGFSVKDGKAERQGDSGVVVSVDLGTLEVEVRTARETLVERSAERTATSTEPDDPERVASAEAELERDVERELEVAEERLHREATQDLERALGDVQQELDQAVTRASAQALKEKAEQLGEISELSENPETGELTIRVKV